MLGSDVYEVPASVTMIGDEGSKYTIKSDALPIFLCRAGVWDVGHCKDVVQLSIIAADRLDRGVLTILMDADAHCLICHRPDDIINARSGSAMVLCDGCNRRVSY